jgi:hypothetical protein
MSISSIAVRPPPTADRVWQSSSSLMERSLIIRIDSAVLTGDRPVRAMIRLIALIECNCFIELSFNKA